MGSLRFLLIAFALVGCDENARAQHVGMARAVLDRAANPSIFADASDDERAAIRHIPSGLVCPLPSNGAFDLEAFPPTAANDGVYCSSVSEGMATTLVAVHFGARVTLDQAFADALAASVGQAAPVRWSGEPSAADRAPPEGLPHFRIARFQGTVDDTPHYIRVAMTEVDGWFLQQIVSAPIADAEAAETKAGDAWRVLLREAASAD